MSGSARMRWLRSGVTGPLAFVVTVVSVPGEARELVGLHDSDPKAVHDAGRHLRRPHPGDGGRGGLGSGLGRLRAGDCLTRTADAFAVLLRENGDI